MRWVQESKQVLLVLGVTLGVMASTALAEQRILPPTQPGVRPQPRLGFYGHMEYGWGMTVDRVLPYTPASRAGLEPGDVILKIDNRRIRCERDYDFALRHAGRRVELLVDDVRGRGLVPVMCYLDYGSGPVLLRVSTP